VTGPIAQISQPSEGLDAGLYMPLYLVVILYVVLFVAGRVLAGREDERADTVQDGAFALMLLAGAYVAALLFMAVFSEFDLIADLFQIMAIVIAFFVLLVVALLGLELLVGLTGRTRKREHAAPPPGDG
jgi:hypothetical protein